MKKFLKKFLVACFILMFTTQGALAVTTTNFWKKSGNDILLIDPDWNLGSLSQPVPIGYFDTINVGGIELGAPNGSLDLTGDLRVNKVDAANTPSVALINPAAAGNVDNGDHKYKVTFTTLLGETEPSSASVTVSVVDKTVNGKVVVTIPVSPASSVLARKIYRQFNGTGNYKLVATVNNNTATTYTDNIANASLGGNAPSENSTGSIFAEGGIQSPGQIAIGNNAVIASDRNVDFSREITDFGMDSQYNVYSEVTLNPSSTVGTGNESFVASENFLEIPSGNSQNFNLANFSNAEFFFDHNGSGDVSNMIALWGAATNAGSGDITYELVGGYFTSYNNGSGTIKGNCFKCGNFAVAAGTGNRGNGVIEDDYTYYAESPYQDLGGVIGRHWGFYMEDQEFGNQSWAIQTHGGKVEFGAPTGKNSLLYLSSDDVVLPFTGFLPANAYGRFTSYDSVQGGLKIDGYGVTDNPGLKLGAYIGTDGNLVGPTMLFDVGQDNGSGGITGVGSLSEASLYSFRNNNQAQIDMTSYQANYMNLDFKSPNFSHTVTDILPSTTYGRIGVNDGGDGGLKIMGASGASGVYPFVLHGIEADTDAAAATVTIRGSKKSGAGLADLGDAEVVMQVVNNDNDVSPALKVFGDGSTGFLGAVLAEKTNAAGGSANSIQIDPTLGIMNGSDSYAGLNIDLTNANHTGTGNNVRGIYIDGITFDAQATATAIEIGSGGWNYGLALPTNIGVAFGDSKNVQAYYDGTNLNFTGGDVHADSHFISGSGFSVDGNAFTVDETGAGNIMGLEVTGYLQVDTNVGYSQANLASATNLDLQTTQRRVYHVTGNTQIDCIIPGSPDTFTTFIFDSNPVVRHNQTCTGGNIPLLLSGSANYSTAAGSVLTIYNDNQNFAREVSRVNP